MFKKYKKKGALIRFAKDTDVYMTAGGPMFWKNGEVDEATIYLNKMNEVIHAEIGWGCGQDAIVAPDLFKVLTPEEWGCKDCKWNDDEFCWKCDSCFSKEFES